MPQYLHMGFVLYTLPGYHSVSHHQGKTNWPRQLEPSASSRIPLLLGGNCPPKTRHRHPSHSRPRRLRHHAWTNTL